jgi:peptide deformylase
MVALAAPVLELGHPALRQVCAPAGTLDAELAAGAATLQATLAAFRSAHGFGRAIAAPQIGITRRLVAMDLGDAAYPDGERGPLLMVDPEFTWKSDDTFTLWDDCMSFPWLLVRVRRHASVSLSFRDATGRGRRWERVPRALAGVLALDRAEAAAPGLDGVIGRGAFAAEPARYRAQVDYLIGE